MTSQNDTQPGTYGVINDTFLKIIESNPQAHRFLFYGGAGSGKSVFIAMFICLKLLFGKNERILVIRKWLPALKISAYPLILEILEDWGVLGRCHLNKSDLTLSCGTNRIYFSGLDNPEKIKSAEFTYIWLEEATDFTLDDSMQLNLRLGRSKRNAYAKIIYSFNPIDQFHWLVQEVMNNPDERTIIHHSTYLDNYDNLSQEFIDRVEGLIKTDENYYRVYAKGLPGVLKNIIYTNYVIENYPFSYKPDGYGLDFGFSAPMAFLEVKFKDEEPYCKELLYQTGMTTRDLLAWMKAHEIDKKIPIYADSAEPDRIEEIKGAGYNIHPAKKDVVAGIDRVKSYKLHIHSRSSNLISEIQTYKFRETKDGQVLEEPLPFKDHLMDSLRYMIYTSKGPYKPKPIPATVSAKSQTGHLFRI